MSTDTYAEFIEQNSGLFAQLAHAGWTPSEAYHRITVMYPHLNSDFVHQAVNSGQWTFVGRKENLLNNVMMGAALWYAVAVTHDMQPDPEFSAVHLDPIIAQDIPRFFSAIGVSDQHIADIINKCGAALHHLSKNPYVRLDEASYDDFLENLPPEAQGITDEVFTWPPSRMIIEDRLGEGSFSKALLRVGICPPDLEEMALTVAPASVTDRAFRNALGEFLSYCIRYDRKPSMLLYGNWAVARNQLSRVPLLGAVRAKYGSWHRALKLGRRMINDALKMSSAQAVPARLDEPETTQTASFRIEDLKAQGIGVVQSQKPHPQEVEKRAWESLSAVLQSQLQELPWNQVLRVYYVSPESTSAQELTPYATILRSPGGYLCELTDSVDFVAFEPQFNVEFLASNGWAAPRDGSAVWSHNFFNVAIAAPEIIAAMRFGMGCTRSDYFQSENPTHSAEFETHQSVAHSLSGIQQDSSTSDAHQSTSHSHSKNLD